MITNNIKTAKDLITTHKATVEGFLSQALAKTSKAMPFVEQAHHFWIALQTVQNVDTLDTLLDDSTYRRRLIAAAGLSDKAIKYLTEEEIEDAVKRVFLSVAENSGEAFREEILYRYLLTAGDSLGGQMRNYVGAEAGYKLTRFILDALPNDESLRKITESATGKIQKIEWENRLLWFDSKPKLIDNNVDAILFDISSTNNIKEVVSDPKRFLACGELKGGIDPAGADEHWKTTLSGLNRIREKLQAYEHTPAIFFVGAAIATKMAVQMFSDLESGELTFAANLTKPEQVSDLANWLVSL